MVVGCLWRGSGGRGRVEGGREGSGVSDQGSGFGLVASVPLHVCQLRAQGAAEEAAVAERPAAHGGWGVGGAWSEGGGFTVHTVQYKGLMWPVQLLK